MGEHGEKGEKDQRCHLREICFKPLNSKLIWFMATYFLINPNVDPLDEIHGICSCRRQGRKKCLVRGVQQSHVSISEVAIIHNDCEDESGQAKGAILSSMVPKKAALTRSKAYAPNTQLVPLPSSIRAVRPPTTNQCRDCHGRCR